MIKKNKPKGNNVATSDFYTANVSESKDEDVDLDVPSPINITPFRTVEYTQSGIW